MVILSNNYHCIHCIIMLFFVVKQQKPLVHVMKLLVLLYFKKKHKIIHSLRKYQYSSIGGFGKQFPKGTGISEPKILEENYNKPGLEGAWAGLVPTGPDNPYPADKNYAFLILIGQLDKVIYSSYNCAQVGIFWNYTINLSETQKLY